MCTIYGYARISTNKQSIERQIRNIKAAYPTAVILTEAYTGTKTEGRKEYTKLIKAVKPGDTIVFDSVSRMSRNAAEGFEAYQKFYNDGVELVFLKEPHINTAVYKKSASASVPMTGTDVDLILTGINAYLMHLAQEQIKIAFEQSEKEVSDLQQRTREGIETARLNGKQIGRAHGQAVTTKKSEDAKKMILKHSKDFNGTLTDIECMQLLKVARNTFYKYKRELKENA